MSEAKRITTPLGTPFVPLTEDAIDTLRRQAKAALDPDHLPGRYDDRVDTLCDMALASLSLPSPCGHPSQYAYSEDGGAHMVCLLCEREHVSEMQDIVKLAERCRPAVAHYMRTNERSAMSEALSATGKQAAEDQAAKLGKLLDEIDALLATSGPHQPPTVPGHRPVS